MHADTDEELMNLSVQGDVRAFDKLYLRHQAKVYGYLMKRLSVKQHADEVFQNAFLKLHQSRAQFSSAQPFLPWLFAIARNALFDHLRKGQSESRKVSAMQEHLLTYPSDLDDNCEAHPLLEKGLLALTESQRELLNKRYVEGLDFEEMASQSHSNPAAVRQSVSRVTRKLKDILKGISS